MAQTSMAEFYLRRSSVTSSVAHTVKEGLEEARDAHEEMLLAYGASLSRVICGACVTDQMGFLF